MVDEVEVPIHRRRCLRTPHVGYQEAIRHREVVEVAIVMQVVLRRRLGLVNPCFLERRASEHSETDLGLVHGFFQLVQALRLLPIVEIVAVGVEEEALLGTCLQPSVVDPHTENSESQLKRQHIRERLPEAAASRVEVHSTHRSYSMPVTPCAPP